MGDNIIKTAASAVESVFTDSTAESDFTAPGQPEASAEQQLVIDVKHVSGGYRTPGLIGRGKYQQVLYDVDFNIRHGEIMGLVGESGTGKSTLARMILGMVKPEEGEIIH